MCEREMNKISLNIWPLVILYTIAIVIVKEKSCFVCTANSYDKTFVVSNRLLLLTP